MGPQRVVTLRRGLRDAGLKDISHGAPQTFISARSTLQSGKKSISLGAPGKGYGIRFSSLASFPSNPRTSSKKPRRRVEIVGERRWRWRSRPCDILEMEGYPSLPLRVSLSRYSTKSHVPICPFTRNTFSFISSLMLLLRSYSIQFFSSSLYFFNSPCGSLLVVIGVVPAFCSPSSPPPVLSRTWLGPFYMDPITIATPYNPVRAEEWDKSLSHTVSDFNMRATALTRLHSFSLQSGGPASSTDGFLSLCSDFFFLFDC